MRSIHRQLLLPIALALALALALVLPLACGSLGPFGSNSQSNSVANRDGGNECDDQDDEDDEDDCDDSDHSRDAGRPDSGICHSNRGDSDHENEGDDSHHSRDGGSSECCDKVAICHFPPGNPGNAHTIRVGAPALMAHLAHGDHLGPCGPGEGHCGGRDGGQQDGGHPPDGG